MQGKSHGYRQIQVISFDFWNTLFWNTRSLKDERASRIADAVRLQCGRAKAIEHILMAMERAWNKWDTIWIEEQRTLTVQEWLVLVLEELSFTVNSPLDSIEFNNLCTKLQEAVFSGISIPVPHMPAVLLKLAESYDLAVISDTGVASGMYLSRLMERYGISGGHIPCRVYSDETGISKPHPGMFNAVLNYYQCLPEQMVHIGDLRKTDIAGAKALGIRTIRYAGIFDDVQKPADFDADIVIYNYTELPELLRKWEDVS